MKITVTEVKEILDIKFEDIISAYIGKRDECMCGCFGTYYYLECNKDKASKSRGYPVSPEEVNEKRVKYVFNKIMGSQPHIEVINNYIFTAYQGDQQYTLYFEEVS
jgi:hypothetical protein